MAIQFYLTNVGRTAALNADILGLDLQIKYIAVGSGQYNAATAAPTKTDLTMELGRYLVNGGEIEPTTHTLRFTVNLNSAITADIYEIGLFDENNVLFAVASSTTTPLVRLINEVITIITFGFSLDDVDNITLMLDVNSPLAVTLMNQHAAHEHPHAQYKRINDDTERLKVANGVSAKDAVNKEQLDAVDLARTNDYNHLQNTKAELNGDNTQLFKVASAVSADDAVAKSQLDTLAQTVATKANKNGDAAETFNVANGTSGSHAVNKSQLDTVANAIPTLPTLATETILGLVEKATQTELNNGTANVWPDAAILLSGFSQGVDYFKLPQFLGGWKLHWGEYIKGDFTPEEEYTLTFTGFTSVATVLIGTVQQDSSPHDFVVHRRSFNNSSVTVVFDEWSGISQQGAGFWYLVIGK